MQQNSVSENRKFFPATFPKMKILPSAATGDSSRNANLSLLGLRRHQWLNGRFHALIGPEIVRLTCGQQVLAGAFS